MPVYEYRCECCGTQFEKLVRSSGQAVEVACPACQSTQVKKLLSAPAVRSGDGIGTGTHEDTPAPTRPAVFGRKELEALKKK